MTIYIVGMIKNNNILNNKTSFLYKGDYFFNENFRIRVEDGEKIESNNESIKGTEQN
jgi:hypothetical protein